MESEVLIVVRKRWYRNQDILFPLLLTLLGILFFADLIFTTKNFYFRDVLNFHYPLRKVMIDSYARWEFPLWNPYVYLGQPMLANPNYLAFYPTNLLHLILPFAYAFKLHMIIHAILAGLGIYFLQRRLGIDPLPALAGSVAYQFSGTVLSLLNLFNITPCIALLPWIGWAFLGCLQRFSKTRALGFGALLGLQTIIMEPIMLQGSAWLVAAIAAVYLLQSPNKTKAVRVVLKSTLVGILFAAGLSAIQVLPSLESLQLSVRAGGYEGRFLGYWSMHPVDLLNVVVPNLFGSPYSMWGDVYWGEKFHSDREGYLVSLFLGTGTFILGMLSFFSSRKKLQRIFVALALISVILAAGQFGGVYLWLCKWIPILRFGRYPVKYMLLGTLALSILASLGLESALCKQNILNRRRIPGLATLSLGLVLGVAFLCFSGYAHFQAVSVENWLRAHIPTGVLRHKDLRGITQQLVQSFRWSGLFAIISVSLIFSSLFWKRRVLIGGLLVFVLGAELLAENARLSPLISGADFEYVSEADTFLTPPAGAELYRVYSVDPPNTLLVRRLYAPNQSVAWIYLYVRRAGLPFNGIISGVQYSFSRSVDDLNTRESNEIYLKSPSLRAEDYLSLLGRLNTSTLLSMGVIDSPQVLLCRSFDTGSDQKLNVYRLKNSFPRAYFVPGVRWVDNPSQALTQLLEPDFPYQQAVILEGTARPVSQAGMLSGKSTGKARILNYESTRVRCEVEAETKGHLVLLDSYYPGWRVTLDGSSAPLLRANYAFRAVEVPSGKHLVEFHYRPLSFYLGLLVTGVTVLLGLCFAIGSCSRREPD